MHQIQYTTGRAHSVPLDPLAGCGGKEREDGVDTNKERKGGRDGKERKKTEMKGKDELEVMGKGGGSEVFVQ